jgi:hypothetical protein
MYGAHDPIAVLAALSVDAIPSRRWLELGNLGDESILGVNVLQIARAAIRTLALEHGSILGHIDILLCRRLAETMLSSAVVSWRGLSLSLALFGSILLALGTFKLALKFAIPALQLPDKLTQLLLSHIG